MVRGGRDGKDHLTTSPFKGEPRPGEENLPGPVLTAR